MKRDKSIRTMGEWKNIFIAVMLLTSHQAFAAQSAPELCDDIARKANRVLWDEFRKAADETVCRKPWTERTPGEFLACGGENKAINVSNKARQKWNKLFQGAEWATWGPRGIDKEWEKGTIRGGFKRTFFGPGLAMNTSKIEVKKTGGKARATMTVCELNQNGKVVKTHRKEFDKKAKDGLTQTINITNGEDTKVIAVIVDTPASINSFQYQTRLVNSPIRNNLGPVKGLADLHVHQLASLAFGGRLYWGEHDGPEKYALAKEIITTKEPKNEGNIKLTADGMDANIAMKAMKSTWDDEGFVRLGGGGYPKYENWPHHADRSHQQVYIKWLEQAVKRRRDKGQNLGLMVLSIVHNDILCSALKFIDKRGNIPRRNAAGEIVGWESGPWGCTDDENIKRQLAAAHELDRKYSWYRIAMTPWHARQIIKDGDLAVVISLESDKPLSGPDGNYGNWEHQLDFYRSQGVTTMQIVHESDSIFCGAAQHRTDMRNLQALHWPLKSLENKIVNGTTFRLDSRGHNLKPFTKEGRELVNALVQRNMPIDLAHGSVICRRGVMNQVPKDYALYDSHTKFEKLLKPSKGQRNYGTQVLAREKTFNILEELEQEYLDNKVLIGLRAASVDVYDAPNSKVENTCPGSARSFAQMVQYANDRGFTFAYGTDFNTGVSQLGPRFGKERCYASRPELESAFRTTRPVGAPNTEGKQPPMPGDQLIAGTNYYVDGLATIGWLPELTADLVRLGTPGARKLSNGAEAFLNMWERAYDYDKTGQKAGANTTSPARCTADKQCRPNEFCSKPALRPDAWTCLPKASLTLGAVCTSDKSCQSGKCSGIDGRQGTCICNDNGDCRDGEFCQTGAILSSNSCLPLASLDIGRHCDSDKSCKSGRCSGIDGHGGSCVCNDDNDCGSGKWCNMGLDLKKNSCERKLNIGEVCGTVGELKVGHRCKSGKCKVAGLSSKLKCVK